MVAKLQDWDVLIAEIGPAYNMYGCKVVATVWKLPTKILNYHARLRGCASPAVGKFNRNKFAHLIADCRKYREAGLPKGWRPAPFDPRTYKAAAEQPLLTGHTNRWGIPPDFEGDFMKEWRQKRSQHV